MKAIARGAAVLLFLLTASCNTGLDRLRYEADLRDYKLAKRCASGWFTSRQFTQEEETLVNQALGDWETRLAADAQLLGIAPEGSGR